MKYIANFLRNPTEFLNFDRQKKILILSLIISVFLCLLILLAQVRLHQGEETITIDNVTSTLMPITSTTTPTKWWIKRTATSPSIALGATTSTALAASSSNCPAQFSSPLKAEIYAYISLSPPQPNRIRSSAGISSTYLGQIEPGGGLKIIDGPICADGYSWWLVESLFGGLQGWTVEGKSSEQWILPCPNDNVACTQTAVPTSSSVESKDDKNKDKNEYNCKSDKLAVDMFAQVGQDSLLVVRSEPQTGRVIGRASPMSVLKILDGPACAGGSVWWNLNIFDLGLIGWAIENDLYVCPKDSECNLWPS